MNRREMLKATVAVGLSVACGPIAASPVVPLSPVVYDPGRLLAKKALAFCSEQSSVVLHSRMIDATPKA
jgi:hypothetical protein